ncbi:type IV pilus biogenesis/stability protein PilW [Lysobacter niabensis]|uniref:type IV pilus biogenesis/stability protein PilW n=1 Tax=Agrilutibacter niabensis TaxID=380628 RepID=UPI00361C8F6D
MPLRKALTVLLAIAAVAAAGCGDKSYVRTSLGKQHYVEPAVNRISESSDKRNRDNTASMQRDLGEILHYLSAGDLDGAKQRANDLVKRSPDSAAAHTYLAVALDRSGDKTAAGHHYLRAAELAPDNGGALGNYGIWLCGQGNVAEALTWFDRALATPEYADSPVVLANSGACAGKAGQQQRAERDLRRAIALAPENPVALAALAQREFGAGNAFEARAFSERRLAAAPADPRALLLASQIEQKLGDSAAAARYVSRLKAEFPDAPEARNSAMGDGGRQ